MKHHLQYKNNCRTYNFLFVVIKEKMNGTHIERLSSPPSHLGAQSEISFPDFGLHRTNHLLFKTNIKLKILQIRFAHLHSNRPTVHVINQRDTTLYIQSIYHSTQRNVKATIKVRQTWKRKRSIPNNKVVWPHHDDDTAKEYK